MKFTSTMCQPGYNPQRRARPSLARPSLPNWLKLILPAPPRWQAGRGIGWFGRLPLPGRAQPTPPGHPPPIRPDSIRLRAVPILPAAMPVPSFVEPCLPSPADRLPDGPDWVHEIKHDGYPADGAARSGRHPAADQERPRLVAELSAHRQGGEQAQGSLLPDGEAVACDDGGLPTFQLLRSPPRPAG
jgi:hypothetical protein